MSYKRKATRQRKHGQKNILWVTDHDDYPGNYVDKIMKVTGGLAGLPPGSATMIVIGHDSWCGMYRGRPCNCDPWLRVKEM